MTVQELASKLNELYREGKGNLQVRFVSGNIDYPIILVKKKKLAEDCICLEWVKDETPTRIN